MDIMELKKLAEQKVNPRELTDGCAVASVASALLTDRGNVYIGVNIDTACSMGFCAEHSAIAQMITNEESRIVKVVAVGRNGKIMPPCGRCREFMHQINHENLDAEVLVEKDKTVKLEELLPYRFE